MDKHLIALSLGNIVGSIIHKEETDLCNNRQPLQDQYQKELLQKLQLKKLPIIFNGQFFKISDVVDKPSGGKAIKCVCMSCPKHKAISATLGSNSNLLSHLMVRFFLYEIFFLLCSIVRPPQLQKRPHSGVALCYSRCPKRQGREFRSFIRGVIKKFGKCFYIY